MTQVLFALIVSTAIAILGATLGVALGDMARRRNDFLVHLATGTLLGITAFDVLPEAKNLLAWPVFLVAAASGYFLLWACGKFLFSVCPSCAIADNAESSNKVRKGSLILLATALGIHCILDGVGIAAGAQITLQSGLGIFFGVAVHKLPEGLALALLLASAGYGPKRILLAAAGIESLTILGGLTTRLAIARSAYAPEIGIMLAIVGGSFVYLVMNALGGALLHRQGVSFRNGLAIQLGSFACTGILFWIYANA